MQLDPRQWTSRKRTVMLLTALLVVLAAAFVFMLMRPETKKTSTDDAINKANSATEDGNYDAALEALKKVESTATNTEEKVRLYNELAAAAANASKLQDALEYYTKKHALDPDTRAVDGYLVGELYERVDNPQKAIEYYKLYVEHLETSPQEEFGGDQVESINERIRQLEGQQ
jgi:tetratricopeptide (TPR) repeat protein